MLDGAEMAASSIIRPNCRRRTDSSPHALDAEAPHEGPMGLGPIEGSEAPYSRNCRVDVIDEDPADTVLDNLRDGFALKRDPVGLIAH